MNELGLTRSIPEQFLQLLSRLVFAGVGFGFGRPLTAREGKVFAEIADALLGHGFRAAVAALMRRPRVVTDAIEAHAQVCAAAMAALAPPWLAGERPFPTAIMAMSSHAFYTNFRRAFFPAEANGRMPRLSFLAMVQSFHQFFLDAPESPL